MKELVAIGEVLIDFIPDTKGKRLKDVVHFKRVAGGAPANVAGAVVKLGGKSTLLTGLGQDAFGDYIISLLEKAGICTKYILRSEHADTSLAFVSLAEDGNLDFKFYRRTAADLQYSCDHIPDTILNQAGAIHFCSVDLVDSPMKEAHKKLIKLAKEKHVLVSFDPNIRLGLWEDHEALKKTVQAFIACADILKISDEELNFITGYTTIEDALPSLWEKGVKMVIYTQGKDGALLYRPNQERVLTKGFKVAVKDTTGAGDSFIGAFLYRLLAKDITDLAKLSNEELHDDLKFANAYAALTTTKEGALDAMATKPEFDSFYPSITNDD